MARVLTARAFVPMMPSYHDVIPPQTNIFKCASIASCLGNVTLAQSATLAQASKEQVLSSADCERGHGGVLCWAPLRRRALWGAGRKCTLRSSQSSQSTDGACGSRGTRSTTILVCIHLPFLVGNASSSLVFFSCGMMRPLARTTGSTCS